MFSPVALQRSKIVAITELCVQVLQDSSVAFTGGATVGLLKMILEVALDPVVVEQSVVNINKDNKGMRGRHSELRNAQAGVLNQIPRQHVDVNRSTRIGFPSMARAQFRTFGSVHYRSLLRDTNLQENRHFQLSFAKLREKSSVAFA